MLVLPRLEVIKMLQDISTFIRRRNYDEVLDVNPIVVIEMIGDG